MERFIKLPVLKLEFKNVKCNCCNSKCSTDEEKKINNNDNASDKKSEDSSEEEVIHPGSKISCDHHQSPTAVNCCFCFPCYRFKRKSLKTTPTPKNVPVKK